MAPDLNNLVRLARDRAKPAAEMLARAFRDYPLMVYFYPDASERMKKGVHSFQSLLRYGVLYGEVYATSTNLEGVAMWLTSKRTRRTLWANIRSGDLSALLRVRRKNLSPQRSYINYSNSVHERCAPFPHLYLQLLGIDPVHQGKGYSSMLLRAMFARIDKEGLPCYLETQAEKNVGIYEHLGFKVVEEGIVPGSNVTSWAMLREAE